jgi:hypothetical protein
MERIFGAKVSKVIAELDKLVQKCDPCLWLGNRNQALEECLYKENAQ